MSNSLTPELVKEFVKNAHIMVHAKAGGDHSIEVVQFLESL